MPHTTRILMVEHNPDDIELILDQLKDAGIVFTPKIVQQKDTYIEGIKDFKPHIILSDYSLPAFDGPQAFKIREELVPLTPFLFVSGSIGEEKSVEYIRNGVTDYVLKDKLFTLGVKVKRALKEAQEQEEKSRTEKVLALSESRLARAQQVARLGSWELNFDDNELKLSVEGARIFGLAPGEKSLAFKNWSSLVHPDDIDDVLQMLQQSQMSLKDTAYHHRILLKDGTIKYIYSESKFEFDEEGNSIGLYGTMQDITEQAKQQAAIQQAYEEKNTVLERIDDGFFATDKNSIVTYWNKRAEILLAIKKEEVIDKNLHEVFSSTASPGFYNNYQKAIKGNITVHFEEFSKRTQKWFAVSAFGSVNGLSVYFKDISERKSAEHKLKENELRYRSLIEQATDAICIADSSMKFIDINQYACEIFGYTAVEALQLNLTDILFKEDLDENPLKVNELKLGKIIRNERRLKRKDGTAVVMEVSTRIMEDGMLIMFGHDITEKKRAEEQLISQEKRYRALVENGADAVVILNAEGKPIYASPTILKVLGYTIEESLELDLFSMFHPDDIAWAIKIWEQLMATESTPLAVRPSRMKHKDGSWHWLEGTLTNLLHDPAVLGIVDNFRDVTAQQELEVLLKKTNSLARVGSWEVNMQKGSLFWSDITKEIHEADEGFLPEMQTAINFYKEGHDRDTITQKVQEAIDKGFPFDVELQITTAKKNEKWVRVLGEAEFENGKASRINGSFQDITDRKLAEIRLNELNQNINQHAKELAISNAELEQFAYVASHDLQEPLRMVTSFLTQLEKKYGNILDQKGKQYISFAVDGALRMRQIILDLLEFSRVGRTEENMEHIDLNELIVEVRSLLRKSIQEKNASITIDDLPQVMGHKGPMRQVFQNLISNALKYSVANIPAQIHITVKDLLTHWQFAVSDNGIGIAKQYFDKIFIIFQRLHNKNEYSGTGMGLAVTKKIIETLGGQISVESEQGRGSTFYFTMLKVPQA